MRVVTYGRVSGAEQAESGTSLADQANRLRQWATSDGREHVGHFADPGHTGGVIDRPGLNALRERVTEGGVDAVVVTKSDRFARELLVQLTLAEEFSRHGAVVVCIDEGVTTATAEGQLHGGILGVVAQFERQRIAARTRAGRRAAADEGRFVGSTPPFGYRVVGEPRNRRLAIHEKQARTVRAIYEKLVVAREQAKDVAAWLNDQGLLPAKKKAWDAATLRRWAKDNTHITNVSGTWTFENIEVSIPAIMTPSEAAFWRTWAREARTVFPQRAAKTYLLSNLVIMPCGRRAMGRTAGKQRPTYSCRDRLSADVVGGHEDCINISTTILDSTVIEYIQYTLTRPAILRSAVAGQEPELSPAAELTKVQHELAALDDRIAEEVAMLREVGIRRDALEAAIRPLKADQDALAARARGLRRKVAEESVGLDNKRVRDAVEALRDGFELPDHVMWRQLFELMQVVVRITGHADCPVCDGAGYEPNAGRVGRGWARRCQFCLTGTQPLIEVEMHDVVALAVAEGLAASG